MAGRFPLLTDENVTGPLVAGLRLRGWDVLTVKEVFGQESVDEVLFSYAADHGRALVTTDEDCLVIGRRWLDEARPFRVVFWRQGPHQRVRVAPFLAAFDELGEREHAFASGIEYLRLTL